MMTKIETYFLIDTEKERLKYFQLILIDALPSFLNNKNVFNNFCLIWRENIIKIKYINELSQIINEIIIKRNHFGEKNDKKRSIILKSS